MNKYHAQRTKVDGLTFDSKREAARYQELKLLERAGAIKALATQPSYDIWVEGMRICRYKADFVYFDAQTGKQVIEDVKSEPTKTPVYRLKKKLMKATHGIEIQEV